MRKLYRGLQKYIPRQSRQITLLSGNLVVKSRIDLCREVVDPRTDKYMYSCTLSSLQKSHDETIVGNHNNIRLWL